MNASLLQTLLASFETVGVSWELAENPIAARLALLSYLSELGRKDIVAWDPEALPLSDLKSAMADVGMRLHAIQRGHLEPEGMVGLTGADAALADSGTLVFVQGAGRSWLPGLLPLHHVVLLPVRRIFPDLRSWYGAWHTTRPQDVSRALLVTGLSVNDDIELHAHHGLFGPGRMHVLVFEA
ncbi:MAG TPA: hypothetical protein ENK60_04120 [Anaerolineae bacterium]|nr:hypothetical protein [Anaerolineae bacterium]